jgi:23S rRNA (pseudouridine1915-N3)-methyltransferase
MPGWVDEALADYGARLPSELQLEWRQIKAESRAAGGSAAQWLEREAVRIRGALPAGATVIALDESGQDLSSADLAAALARWREAARPLAILIGGPDGLQARLKAAAAERIRLSSLTLPHAMVRVLWAEQLFRAWSILNHHPYHRA